MAGIKRISVSLLSAAALLAANCVELPAPFERIEVDKPRLIDFMYEPAEASPGDTVTVRAIFAGRTVLPGDISWSISYKVLKNIAGVDTAYDIRSLGGVVDTCEFSAATSCITVRFVVPDDCIVQSPMIRENMAVVLSDELKDKLPEGFDGVSLDETLAMMDSLAGMVAVADTQMLQAFSSLRPDIIKQLPLISQLFTVPIRIIADVAGQHRIESDYSVSYTRSLARLPGGRLFENHNPVIDSVGVYKVKGTQLMKFDRQGVGVEYFRLSGGGDSSVIPVDSGYSYFVEVAASGRDTVVTLGDTAATLDDTAGGAPEVKVENFVADWMFQMDEKETEDITDNQLMFVSALGDCNGILSPPQKEKVRHFTIWVQVTDSKLGILNRSQGSAVAEVRGVFSYSERYGRQFK